MANAETTKDLVQVLDLDYAEQPALPSDLKTVNRMNILKCFADGKDYTISDISLMTGISKITTMRAIHFFCDRGVLAAKGKLCQTNTMGGKYPELFGLNIKQYILNITVWSQYTAITLMDFHAVILNRIESRTIVSSLVSFDEVQDFVMKTIPDFLESAGITRKDIYAVTYSTSGVVDYRTLLIKYNSQAPEWGMNLNVLDPLKAFFGDQPVYFVENGGKFLGRTFLNRPELKKKRAVIVNTSWGISGSFIQNGRILNGRNSMIGEIGHMIIDRNDKVRCNCGSFGCLERMVDFNRIRERLNEADIPKESALSTIDIDNLVVEQLFEFASAGDETAREIVAYLADCFALALHNITLSFNPDYVYFVGAYSHDSAYFDHCLKEKMKEFRYYDDQDPFETRYEQQSMLDLEYVGAAITISDIFFSNPDLYEGE